MPVCGVVTDGQMVLNPTLTGAQCIEAKGFYIMSGTEIAMSAVFDPSTASSLFFFGFSGPIIIWFLAFKCRAIIKVLM